MTVSIVIAVKTCCENLKECVSKCLELGFKDYEIIILPDSNLPLEGVFSHPKIRIIPTGNVTPPKKRDVGAKYAKGEILAFLDDDAYPNKNWLKEAVNIFKESDSFGCVCGPAITPLNDSILQKGSGLVYASPLVSGNHNIRYISGSRKEVFDFPSCNFLIRKELFNQVGGFDKYFWPGEDTFLCLKILEAGKKMIYSPRVLVYHHRRNLFKGHLKQIKSYGLHRGYFAKKYPKTSLCFEYFTPSVFVIILLTGGIASLSSSLASGIYSLILTMYFILIIASSLSLVFAARESRINRIKLLFLTVPGIFLTHVIYGIYFIKGLFTEKMSEEKEA